MSKHNKMQKLEEFHRNSETKNILEMFKKVEKNPNPFPDCVYIVPEKFRKLVKNEKFSGKLPEQITKYISEDDIKNNKDLVHDLLLDYAKIWMYHTFGLFPGRIWYSYEAIYFIIQSDIFYMFPIYYLHKKDLIYILRYYNIHTTYESCNYLKVYKRCGSSNRIYYDRNNINRFYDLWLHVVYSSWLSCMYLNKTWYKRKYYKHSLLRLLDWKDDIKHVSEESQLDRFIEETNLMKKELELVKQHNIDIFCVKCSNKPNGLCGYCSKCCPHNFREHRKLKK